MSVSTQPDRITLITDIIYALYDLGPEVITNYLYEGCEGLGFAETEDLVALHAELVNDHIYTKLARLTTKYAKIRNTVVAGERLWRDEDDENEEEIDQLEIEDLEEWYVAGPKRPIGFRIEEETPLEIIQPLPVCPMARV